MDSKFVTTRDLIQVGTIQVRPGAVGFLDGRTGTVHFRSRDIIAPATSNSYALDWQAFGQSAKGLVDVENMY